MENNQKLKKAYHKTTTHIQERIDLQNAAKCAKMFNTQFTEQPSKTRKCTAPSGSSGAALDLTKAFDKVKYKK